MSNRARLLAYFLREACGLDRDARGLRLVELRRVRRRDRRRSRRQVVHDVRRASRWARNHHRRGSRPTARRLHPLQQAFWDCHGLQCGYCTPGMLMTSVVLAQAQSPSQRARDPRGARGQSVPLHRLHQHHQIGPASRSRTTVTASRRSRRSTDHGDSTRGPDTGAARDRPQSMKRKEDPRFIRGRGQYVDDIVLPGYALSGARAQSVPARAHQGYR